MADHNKDKEVLKEALERFEESQDASSHNREQAEEDIRFARLGDQWPDDVKKQRIAEGRPCLTINKLPAFIRRVVNDARQNKPGIIVSPVDNGADVDTAEVISGIIRSIERNSGADVAYDTAIDNAVSGGFGFFRIGIDFVHGDTFDMEARIERIVNPFSVHWDTSTTKADASDWTYAFVSDWLTEDQFEARYPEADKVSFEGSGNDAQGYWREDDKVRVAEYWLKEEEKRKLLLLSDGRSVREDKLPEIAKAFFNAGEIDLGGIVEDKELVVLFLEANKLKIRKERDTIVHKVTRRIISGVEVLEEDIWPSELIPICPVWGEEIIDPEDGRRHTRSMIRDARDPQAMFNFWRSATTELVALAPRAPFIGPKGFVPKGQEEIWATANSRSHAYLEYEGAKAPERQAFAGVPAGALQEALNASDDIKAITGIHDAGLGAKSNETSGRAILARQRESDVSNFHFVDNLSRAIQYAGRVLVDIIPSVYTARATMRILGEDQKEKVIKLVSGELQPDKQSGQEKLYDLNVGKYDVTVKAGPSFASQREETREALIEIMRQVPGAGLMIGDIVMEHMDFQNADKVAKRLHRLLPPEVQKAEAEDNAGESDIPEEVQMIIEQGQQTIQQLQAQLQEATQVAEGKQVEQGKLEIERGKLQLDAEKLKGEQEEMQLKRFAEPPKNFEEDMEQLALAISQMAQAQMQATAASQEQTNMLVAGQNQIMQIMAAPKEVVRDESGRVVSVQTITELASPVN